MNVETKISQALASAPDTITIYLQQGRILIFVAAVPALILALLSSTIAVHYGQPKEIGDQMFWYTFAFLPGLLFDGVNDLQRRFLIQTGKPQIVLVSQVTGTCAHLLGSCVFVLWFHFGLVGAALSGTLSSLISLSINLYWTSQQEDLKVANKVKITDLAVTNGLKTYALGCLPLLAGSLAVEAGFFYVSILGSRLNENQQQSSAMFAVIYLMLLQIPRGLGQTLCSCIGFELGRGKVEQAKSYLKQFLKFGAVLLCIELVVFIIFAFGLKGFSSSPQTQSSEFNALSFFAVAFNFAAIVLFGALRALSFTREALLINLVGSLCLLIPLSYAFVFKLNMRDMTTDPSQKAVPPYTDGIHLALLLSSLFQSVMFLIILNQKDWAKSCPNTTTLDLIHHNKSEIKRQDFQNTQ